MSFREGFVEADGFRIRYVDAGDGPVLVHLHGAGGLRLHRGHDLLALKHRVIVMEMPGFGASPENTRPRTPATSRRRWRQRSRHWGSIATT